MAHRLLTFLLILAVLAGLFVAVVFGIGFYLSPQSTLTKADAIVAISGGETPERALTAIDLYKEHWAPILIFSGAAADSAGPSNARAMADQAEASGVPPSAILLDTSSQNTEQNATDVAAIIRSHDISSIILVTSPYHQRRADILFHDALGSNFEIIDHSAVDTGWRRSDWWATPASRSLTLSELGKVAYELIHGPTQ